MASNIVIICDEEIIAKAIRVKLTNLREVDSIKITSKKDAIFEIESNMPNVAILFCRSDDPNSIEYIKEIKETASESKTSILIVTDKLSEDFIVSGFDVGADDLVSFENSTGELMMRTILCMQKNELSCEIASKNKLLAELGVLQPESGYYLKEYAAKVFSTEIQMLQKYGVSATFMAVSADINCKTMLTPSVLGSVIKNCTRSRDKIGFFTDDKFYVLLENTTAKGAIKVYERMKEELAQNENYTISVGACEIENMEFEDLERNVQKSVLEALELGNSIVVYDSKDTIEPMNWLDSDNSTGPKNFKFFQAAFMKKLENVITPVFYRTQQVWESRLFKTTIVQSSDENESLFILRMGGYESVFKITYPGFAKINIDATHSFEDVMPKERVSLDLNELDDEKLSELLLEFIKEFQSYTKNMG